MPLTIQSIFTSEVMPYWKSLIDIDFNSSFTSMNIHKKTSITKCILDSYIDCGNEK